MYKLFRRLKQGIDYNLLTDEEKIVFDMLKSERIVLSVRLKGRKIYKLSDNVNMRYTKEDVIFEVFPNRVIGAFFDYDDMFECKSEGKDEPKVYFLGYAINPDKDVVESFDIGNIVKVKVVARGYNAGNEGLLVRLPNRELDFFSLPGKPCITIGTAGKAKFKDTGMIDFDEEIDNSKFLEGRKGIILGGKVYFNIKDIKETSSVYYLNYNNDKFSLKKIEEKKLYRK